MNSDVNKGRGLSSLEKRVNSSDSNSSGSKVFDFLNRIKGKVTLPLATVLTLGAVGYALTKPVNADVSKNSMMQSFQEAYSSEQLIKPKGITLELNEDQAKTLLKDKVIKFLLGGNYMGSKLRNDLITNLTDGKKENGEIDSLYFGKDADGNYTALTAEFPDKDKKIYVTGFDWLGSDMFKTMLNESLDKIVSDENLNPILFENVGKDATEYLTLNKELYNKLEKGLSDRTRMITDYLMNNGFVGKFDVFEKEIKDDTKLSSTNGSSMVEYHLKVNLSEDPEKPNYKFFKIDEKDYNLLESIKNKKTEMDKRFKEDTIDISWSEARDVINSRLEDIVEETTHVATLEGVKNSSHTGYAGFYTKNEDLYSQILLAYVNNKLSNKVLSEIEVELPDGKKEMNTVRDFEFAGNMDTDGLTCSQGCYYGSKPAFVFKDGDDGYNCNGKKYPDWQWNIIMRKSNGVLLYRISPHLFYGEDQNKENYSHFENLKEIFHNRIFEADITSLANQKYLDNLINRIHNSASLIDAQSSSQETQEEGNARDRSPVPGQNNYRIGGV